MYQMTCSVSENTVNFAGMKRWTQLSSVARTAS